ncbi:MAG: multicopper oxidase domain-containing protein [Blastocatellia bacterium]
MSEEQAINNQSVEEFKNSESGNEQKTQVTRRTFLRQTIAAASAAALSTALPAGADAEAAIQAASCNSPGQPLVPIGELTRSSVGNTLQAVLKVLNENKNYLAPSLTGGNPVCSNGQMRFFAGYNQANPSQKWPLTSGVPTPGPTLRARVGDTVQVTLLNQVDVNAFPNTIDIAEKGQGCDTAMSNIPGQPNPVNTYPGNPSFENKADCFHGSSSVNLHYHGTHVPPSGIGDNVLVNVRPSPRRNGQPVVNEQFVKADFAQIFANCAQGHFPQKWADFPRNWQVLQQALLQQYDKTAPWQGGRGLPPAEQLWPQDQQAINTNQWPQYYIGAYPSCFKIPSWNGQANSMGQAPGTHWYHAHKHGSTALNLANGMAGAFIIEGDYDDVLKQYFTTQQVLVLQQFGTQVNLLRNPFSGGATNAASGGRLKSDLVFVNGQYQPVITMKPNEMQLWRFVNACHQKAVALDAPTGIKWVQTAQDGVQFDPRNYNPSVTNAAVQVPAEAIKMPPWTTGSLASGNRIDLLVQAPSSPGTFQVTFGGTLLLTVNVTGSGIANPMPFPTQAQFPKMPGFLGDISASTIKVRRDLHFLSTPTQGNGTGGGRGLNSPFPPPLHTINGKQFDGTIDQTMMLGAAEEWTLYNDSQVAAHPFHIHVNPFQVVEILDPSISATPVQLPTPWLWWDTFAIPKAAVPPGGTTQVSGYVKIRSRFVDFTGMYVLHCHILGHEDRGMMQLVQVVSNTTTQSHH